MKASGNYLRGGRRRRREVEPGPAASVVEVEERPVSPQPPAPPPRLPAAAGRVLEPAAGPRPALRVGDEEVGRGVGRLGLAARAAARDLVEWGPDAALGVVEVERGGVRELAQQLPRHGRLQVLHRHHALDYHHARRAAAAVSSVFLGCATHADHLWGGLSTLGVGQWGVWKQRRM